MEVNPAIWKHLTLDFQPLHPHKGRQGVLVTVCGGVCVCVCVQAHRNLNQTGPAA